MIIFEDERFWQALDDTVVHMWPAFNDLMAVCHTHRDELPAQMQALLFGAIGGFIKHYNTSRDLDLTPPEAFSEAMAKVQEDPRVQQAAQSAINAAIDEKVKGMKE